MGQVLGFSHCQEYGSVASTPDSTPPCTDGGNEESEMCELQTAREWSDDEEGEDGDPDDDDGLASSPSIWGTPRQNSFELTFSYIAIAEAEAVGASRHLRDRRRCNSRGSRTPLIRTDTLETLLDSPDVDWDPQDFLSSEEEEEAAERREQERTASAAVRREQDRQTETIINQPSPQNLEPETQERDAGIQRRDSPRSLTQITQHPSASLSSQHQSPSQILQASQTPEPESPVTRETISVKLLTSVRPRGPASSSPAAIGRNSQEQLVSDHWFSALNLSEDPTVCSMHIAVMDLIYWKDTERTGMILTGLVVGLLSLFQLSIITVVSTVCLAVMCFTISVRIYYQVLYILSWGDGEHPFKSYLDLDISFSGEEADTYMQKVIVIALSAVDSLKGLFFVGNLFESAKLLVLMYLVTYLGDLCNGLTLLIISVIALFSLPLFYRQRQDQVEVFIAKIQANIDNVKDTFQRLVHGGSPPHDPTPGGAKPQNQ
ncbi:reticulon-2a isoform X2 [Sebastes umbrosus]|uniref:reticulon-2a isoform X2 n=1 Tax=Sebastes umbrosus TaxID=72105 RepID=UPI00189EA607|nr:reticulon-2a isoform X2 [Sebastes umbrosus]